MSASLNEVMLIGRLGKDPEIRRTATGKIIANLNLATSETWRDKATGERKEKTEWHRVVIFSEGLAKVAEQYLKKCSLVFLRGQLQTRKWTDQSGAEKYTTEVVLNGYGASLVMLSSKDGNGGSKGSAPANVDSGDGYRGGSAGATDLDEEIPFAPEWR